MVVPQLHIISSGKGHPSHQIEDPQVFRAASTVHCIESDDNNWLSFKPMASWTSELDANIERAAWASTPDHFGIESGEEKGTDSGGE